MKCSYCQREMIRRRSASGVNIGLAKTKDHVVPYSRGGRKTVPACYTCNNTKGDMYPDVWEWFMRNNPEWWLWTKKELRLARRCAIRMTATLHKAALIHEDFREGNI